MAKVKIILFDIDGVLIRPPHFFSRELEKQGYAGAIKILDSFFGGDEYYECLKGSETEEKLILPHLRKFGWQDSAEEYFKKQFEYEKQFIDQELFSLVKSLRGRGIKCCLCTDQDKYRARFLLKEVEMEKIFDSHFMSCHLGYRKNHINFWRQVMEKLKDFGYNNPEEIAYFDDHKENIEVSSKFGIRAFLFKDVISFKKDLDSLL